MSYQINISLEKNESGYLASCPEITDQQFQGNSLDTIFDDLKKAIGRDLQIKESSTTPPELARKFSTLAQQWETEVEGMSSTARMSQHPAYQEIIQMGTEIVPLLLQELKRNPLYWLSALEEITGENPIGPEQRGRIKQMAEAWDKWGKERGYTV